MSGLENKLEGIVRGSPILMEILGRVSALRLPDWYLVAGCLDQTVWNSLLGLAADYGIEDYDVIYCDLDDASEEAEDKKQREADELFRDLGVKVEAVNQANVHKWLPKYLGYPIVPYTSSEQSVRTWGTICSCVGIQLEGDSLKILAPFGLEDIFKMILRPNPETVFTKELYDKKATEWIKKWPKLKVIPWHEAALLA